MSCAASGRSCCLLHSRQKSLPAAACTALLPGAIAPHLAHPLCTRPTQVKRVNYAGLADHKGHALHMQQALSGGSLLSFETGSTEASKVGRCACTRP